MGQFKDRMVAEMEVRGLASTTKYAYLKSMESFVKFCNKSPDKLGISDIKNYQLYLLHEKRWKLSPRAINRHLSGIAFFYRYVMEMKWDSSMFPRMKVKEKLPVVFSEDEIRQMIDVLHNIKYKAIFMTLYSTGMRLSELRSLLPTDIDSKRMVINIREGKGGRERQALLSPLLLSCLRTYWRLRIDNKSPWLFGPPDIHLTPNNPNRKLSTTSIDYILKTAAKSAKITRKIHPHALRHSFAVHLLEKGTNFRYIQYLLGHISTRSTARYTTVADISRINVKSPLDNLFSFD